MWTSQLQRAEPVNKFLGPSSRAQWTRCVALVLAEGTHIIHKACHDPDDRLSPLLQLHSYMHPLWLCRNTYCRGSDIHYCWCLATLCLRHRPVLAFRSEFRTCLQVLVASRQGELRPMKTERASAWKPRSVHRLWQETCQDCLAIHTIPSLPDAHGKHLVLPLLYSTSRRYRDL